MLSNKLITIFLFFCINLSFADSNSIIDERLFSRDRLNSNALSFTHDNSFSLSKSHHPSFQKNFDFDKTNLLEIKFSNETKKFVIDRSKHHNPKTHFKSKKLSYYKYNAFIKANVLSHLNSSDLVTRELHFQYLKSAKKRARPLMFVFPPIMGNTYVDTSVAKALVKNGSDVILVNMPSLFQDEERFSDVSETIYQSLILIHMLLDQVLKNNFFEIETNKIGVFGVSLGGIIASTLVGAIDEIQYAYILCGGGNLSDIALSSKRKSIELFRNRELTLNNEFKNLDSDQKMREQWRDISNKYFTILDPLVYGQRVDPSKIFMVMSSNDETIPFRDQIELWNKMGNPDYELSRLSHISTIVRWSIESMNHAVEFLLEK